jgi:hypothetical protein
MGPDSGHQPTRYEIILLSYEGAITILQLVAGYSPLLYPAQISIHAMSAYAAILFDQGEDALGLMLRPRY